jgi:transposase
MDSPTPYSSRKGMDSPMANNKSKRKTRQRRSFSEEFKQEAVQMLLDGHSATSVAQRLGLSNANALYRWKREVLHRAGPAARSLGDRVAQLEEELRRVERERDILKKALAILSRQG